MNDDLNSILEIAPSGQGPDEQLESEGRTTSHALVASLRLRYGNAYSTASTIVGLGKFLKGAGLVVFILGAMISVIISGVTLDPTDFVTVLISAAFIWLSLYISGVFVAAQGQMLRALVDCNINTSPFLTDEQRIEAMSLKSQAPDGGAGTSAIL